MSGRVVVVTGTDTGVGKTIVTAALARVLSLEGAVRVVKPAQTGVGSDEESDVEVVRRLAGVEAEQWTELADPLAPDTAARLRSVSIPPVRQYAERVRALLEHGGTVIVEGAGGLLVRLDTDGGTLLDLASDLSSTHDVEVVVVARAGLGTLNHTELTVAALRARGLEADGVVIGAWPVEPDQAETLNRSELPRVTGVPLLGVVPAGAGALSPDEFRATAPTWFA